MVEPNVFEVEIPVEGRNLETLMNERNAATVQLANAVAQLERQLSVDLPSPQAIELDRVRVEARSTILKSIEWGIELASGEKRDRGQTDMAERQAKVGESQARATEAQAQSTREMVTLSSSIKRATWVMAAAVIGQAVIALVLLLSQRP